MLPTHLQTKKNFLDALDSDDAFKAELETHANAGDQAAVKASLEKHGFKDSIVHAKADHVDAVNDAPAAPPTCCIYIGPMCICWHWPPVDVDI